MYHGFYFWRRLLPQSFELLKLNLLFLLCCLPVISIPAALTAMTWVNIRLVEEKSYDLLADFLHIFRTEFWCSLKAGLVLLAGLALFGYVFWFYQTAQTGEPLLLAMLCSASLLPLLLLYCALCYVQVMLAYVSLSTWSLLKNGLFLSVICLRSTIFCLLAGIILLAVELTSLPYSAPFLILFGFSFWNFTCTYFTLPEIKKHIAQSP